MLTFPNGQSKRASDNLTNQNKSDVTTVFTYSHLNTSFDKWESAHYPYHFINLKYKWNKKDKLYHLHNGDEFKNSLIIHKPIDLSNCWFNITWSDFISINLILISMRCFIRYKDLRDLWILITYNTQLITNCRCIFNVVSTNFTHSKFTFKQN